VSSATTVNRSLAPDAHFSIRTAVPLAVLPPGSWRHLPSRARWIWPVAPLSGAAFTTSLNVIESMEPALPFSCTVTVNVPTLTGQPKNSMGLAWKPISAGSPVTV